MLTGGEFRARLSIGQETLDKWVAEGWLLPVMQGRAAYFSDVDVARALLIGELVEAMGVNDEGVGIILDLVDQIHGLRLRLHEVVAAVRLQPQPIGRRVVLDAVRISRSGRAHFNHPIDREHP